MEVAGNFSATSMMEIFNNSGELESQMEFVKGLDLETIIAYVGGNALLHHFGATKISGDPLADNFLHSIGTVMIAKNLPDLPDGFGFGEDGEDYRVTLAKSRLEEQLNLAPGTMRGYGWDEILTSAGKRNMENALGLPGLYLETHSFNDVLKNEGHKAALGYLKKKDRAFNLPEGTIDRLTAGDETAWKQAGVTVIADGFKLPPQQRQALEEAVRGGRAPNLKIEAWPVEREISVNDLQKLFAGGVEDRRQVRASFQEIGLEILRRKLKKSSGSDLSPTTIKLMTDGSRLVTNGEIKKAAGADVLAPRVGVEDKKSLARGDSRAMTKIADYLNREFELSGDAGLTGNDLKTSGPGNLQAVRKIGGVLADKTFGWQSGTGLQVTTGQKSLATAGEEIIGNALGEILGLTKNSGLQLKGDINSNYGRAIMAQRLGVTGGLPPGPDYFDPKTLEDVFGLPPGQLPSQIVSDNPLYFGDVANIDRWNRLDARLGVPLGSTSNYLQGKTGTDDLARQAGRENLKAVAIDQFWNYFELDEALHLSKDEANELINGLSHWDGSSLGQKDRVLRLGLKVAGRSLDRQTNFAIDSMLTILTGDKKVGTETIVAAGIRTLAGILGVKSEKFDQNDLDQVSKWLTEVFNGNDANADNLINLALKATGLTVEYRLDAAAIKRGDMRGLFDAWGAKIWQEELNNTCRRKLKSATASCVKGLSLTILPPLNNGASNSTRVKF